ncbi:methyl-accepting chemotaxis protein [Neobacillus sp.]|jgi:methyl-accepting chemotaxis protein|uniref:methyl-accepting chemotaxis protein n=1 Tax=Neobacillus sp. TaxID=2675273 RepID=UPI0035B55668
METQQEQHRQRKGLSIRVKWIFFICLAILISSGATVIFNHFTISKILKHDHAESSQTNAHHAAEEVRLSLEKYETSINYFARIVSNDVQDANFIQRMEASIKSIQEKNKDLIAVYYMDFTTGKLHISPHMEYDVDVRDMRTYKQLSEDPKTQWMDVYQDKQTKKIMTSIVTPVFTNGKMVGALGYDIDLSAIGAIREQIESKTNAELVILDATGIIVSSFMEGADGKNMNPAQSGAVEGVADLLTDKNQFDADFQWVTNIYKSDKAMKQNWSWNGEKYTGQIVTIPGVHWKVLSFTPDNIFASKMNQFTETGIWSLLLGIAIGAICAIILAEKLRKIIAHFQKVIEKTAEGDLVTEFKVNSKDEVEELARSYNKMLAQMRRLIMTVMDNVSSIHHSTKELTTIASEHSTAISEVSKSVDYIAKGIGNQAMEVEKGSKAVHDLSGSIEELSKQSTIIEHEVGEASQEMQIGNEQVKNLEDSYQKLESAFQKVTERIAQLNEKSKSISEVTKVIAGMAEQTNLLSLNASIEAARAGEHGKGFAVVANEVRKLADESKKATNDIQAIIHSVRSDTKQLVEVMEETNRISIDQKKAVSTVTSSIKQMTASLEKMLESVKEEVETIHSIQEQKSIVVGMIEEISVVSQQTTASTEEIAAAMEEQSVTTNEVAGHAKQLSQLVDELNQAVEKFTV